MVNYQTMKWSAYKTKKGKDFFRNTLEYFEYNIDNIEYQYLDDIYKPDDDEISYKISKKLSKI